MKRTTISLPDDLGRALEREAARLRTSQSAVTREALAAHLGLGPDGEKREIPFAAIASDSDPRYTAARMEEALEEWADEVAADALGSRDR